MTIEATVSGRVNLAQVVSALASISALAKGEEISQWTIDIIRHSADQLQAELESVESAEEIMTEPKVEAGREHKTPEIVEVPEPAYRQPEPDVIVVDRVEAGDRALETAREIHDAAHGCGDTVEHMAALIQSAIDAQERELAEMLRKGVEFFKVGGHPGTSWAEAWIVEAGRLLAERGEKV